MERPDLPAVGVAGDLQVDAVRDGVADLLGLVGQQQHRQVGVGAGQRGGVVGAVPGPPGRAAVTSSTPATTSRSPPRSTTTCRLCSGSQPSSPMWSSQPCGLAVVLVVAGHVDPGQPGPDVAQRRGLLPALGDGAVGDVAGVADDVGVQPVDRLGDPADQRARSIGP